jgi:hypothetical protein
VQALPSLHGPALLTCAHPVAGLHESSVQVLPSLQSGAGPPTHTPFAQASPVVQALPSLHGTVLAECTQPMAGLHASSVQRFPSSQLGGGPPAHEPPLQASPIVHALPSLQGFEFGAWTHPTAGLQESSVQAFRSAQLGGTPGLQTPFTQVSAPLQALPSLQSAGTVQTAVVEYCTVRSGLALAVPNSAESTWTSSTLRGM